MKLILTQHDLEEALRRYVGGMLTLAEGAKMEIEFTAGRGDRGMSAEVDINYLGVTRIAGIADVAVTPAKDPEPIKEVVAKPEVLEGVRATVTGKPDMRTKAAKNLFATKEDVSKSDVPVRDAVDRTMGMFTRDPELETAQEAPDTDREEEAAEILAEPETPPQTAPVVRKSLFSS